MIRRQNELIILFSDKELKRDYVFALRSARTPTMSVDDVKIISTPYGSAILLVTVSTTRNRVSTYEMREWVYGTLQRVDWPGEMKDIHAPSGLKKFRVD